VVHSVHLLSCVRVWVYVDSWVDWAERHPEDVKLSPTSTTDTTRLMRQWESDLFRVVVRACFLHCVSEKFTFLAKRCNFISISGCCHDVLFVVCRLSRRECIVTKRLKLGSCRFHKNVAQCLTSSTARFDGEIRRGSLDRGLKLKWGSFWLRDACYISETVRVWA